MIRLQNGEVLYLRVQIVHLLVKVPPWVQPQSSLFPNKSCALKPKVNEALLEDPIIEVGATLLLKVADVANLIWRRDTVKIPNNQPRVCEV